MKIGIIREGKIPRDSRVVLKPVQCAFLREREGVDLVVQRSEIRCYSDKEYAEHHVPLVDTVDDCDVLIGVKEVPVEDLIAGKTYFFFSHTIKEQPYNRSLLQRVMESNIRLIDYEALKDENGKRLIAFGFYAGMVGAHNALWTYGQRTGDFQLGRMKDVFDYAQMRKTYQEVDWPPVKIVLTGKGRVGAGAASVLRDMGIRLVSPADYIKNDYLQAVYTQVDFENYVRPKPGSNRSFSEYFEHPSEFEKCFQPYTETSDIMINGIYWDNEAPSFFTKEEMRQKDFRIQVIADITCDIAPVSSIPSTLKATTIDDPVFGYDPVGEKEISPFMTHGIDMMTIDNLPNELPRDASTSFGQQFIEHIWSHIEAGRWEEGVLQRATIAVDGRLGPHFQYLKDYVSGE